MRKASSLFIFLLSMPFFHEQDAKVGAIPDGDSFTALFEDKHTEQIRLYGIDCPESGQPFGNAAKKSSERFNQFDCKSKG